MKKGTILRDIQVESLGYGGVGIATLDNGKKVLVKWALPDSLVDVKVIKSKKDYIQAHIVNVQKVANKRIDGDVRCPHYLFPYVDQPDHIPEHKRGCGGCKWQVVSYEKQLILKEKIIEDCFRKLKHKLGDLPLESVLPAPHQYQYRNKIEFSFGKFLRRYSREEQEDPDKRWFKIEEHRNLGFHRQGEFSKIVDVDQCYLVSEEMHQVYETIKEYCEQSGLPVYDAKTQTGFFRHLMMREGKRTGQLLVLLSVASSYLQDNTWASNQRAELLTTLQQDEHLPDQITTCVVVHNNGRWDAIKWEDINLETIWWPGVIFEELHIDEEVSRFQVSPFSFFQTNTLGAELLFSQAIELIDQPPATVIDLYCGSGTIGITLLQRGLGERLIGVDVVPSAIEDARKNAQINNCADRTEFYAGKAERVVNEQLAELELKSNDLVIVDPPREGMHPKTTKFLRRLRERGPYQLLYISCNPVTMARDIELLLEEGFYLDVLQPIDMFPHTHHIETIGILRSIS